MALPILDGNQTATTLSSVVTGGEHIVAHSVVSLGPTAISNIASAISGIPISGTVTANVSAVGNAGETIPDGALVIGLEVGGTLERVSNDVPLPVTAVGAVTIGSLPAISGAVAITEIGNLNINDGSDNLAIGVQSFRGQDPAEWLKTNGGNVPISGAVTANVPFKKDYTVSPWESDVLPVQIISPNNGEVLGWSSNPLSVSGAVTVGNSVTIGSLPAISGTVTVSNVAGFNIPTHDFKSFAYTGGNLTQIAYKTGGASGTTVGILTLAYDGSGNLTSMTRT